MFYLGMRSSAAYLARLATIRASRAPHDVISVAGGLAFLHTLSDTTTSLRVVDVDQDTLRHWSLVRSLLLHSSSLTDFMTLLSGRVATGTLEEGKTLFGDTVDLRRRLGAFLSVAQLATYKKTYGSLMVDAYGVGVARHWQWRYGWPVRGVRTVRFVGADLRRNTFCWHFGEGNLASDATFQLLRTRLSKLPDQTHRVALESLDYDAAYPAATGAMRVVLASNCESPLFTTSDAIFLRVLRTARLPVRYVTWHRDVTVASGVATPSVSAPTTLALDPADTVLFPDRRAAAPLAAPRRTIRRLKDLARTPEYGCRCLLMQGHPLDDVRVCLETVAPAFKCVVWMPDAGEVPTSVGFSLPNYQSERTVIFGDRPAWRFSLVGVA